ncbi:hypothetical protein Slin15195_G044530 [Septoria linicola]|uniref:Uncharacterized protein n=1 Tax=Septoria linicola TaxID=215465 RepID=A0A9Q9EII6_9PEZI|nr:hypothetical protein Slin14017_G048050 [Septoria linicola]USW51134.1 hypothetical protein Slin15195_G044530 [Septoria linicola]
MSNKENQPESLEQQEGQSNEETSVDAQKQEEQPGQQSQRSGRNMDKVLNHVPNMAPEGALGTQTKGPLSAVGDPLGQVLNYGLKPLGHVTGAIGNPNGEALLRVRRVAEHEGVAGGDPKYLPDQDNGKPDSQLPGGERIGGNKQTGDNPLGL